MRRCRSSRRSNRPARVAVCLVGAAALAGACGGSDKPKAGDQPTATTTTTTVAASTTTAGNTPTSGGSAPAGDVWNQDAVQYRGRNGEKFKLACTPPGTATAIWGVETYTDDSSICTAAVQVGLITLAEGGEVEYEIAAGKPSYDAGVAHDITSARYGAWNGSFIFPAAPPGTGKFDVAKESWQRTAVEYRGKNGETVTVVCSPNGPAGSAWGTGTYTDDSSICSAAVHAGLIKVADGGTVVIAIAPGADSYRGTTANGITTSDYGQFSGSFTFPEDQPSK